jgi:hypothetical protein
MTTRCFPQSPSFEAIAERTVWQRLRDELPDDAALFANLVMTDRKGVLEADLAVLWPGFGVVVIEVKGGTVSRAEDGSWIQTSTNGHVKRINPTEQARRCRFALRDFLLGRTSLDGLRMAHLVAFPYTDVSPNFEAPDCPRWMIIDREDVERSPVERIAAALRDAEGPDAPASAHIDAMIAQLTDRPGPQINLIGSLAEREDAVDLLTHEQVGILQMLDQNPRIVVRGGAGTGKSYLAVEQARRFSRAGKRVGFVCYSHGLAAYATRRFGALPAADRPAYIGTLHRLGVQWGAKPTETDDPQYWESELPAEMQRLATHLTDSERFDAFVVDEAQDFADSWWPGLTAGLNDPASDRLTVFTDEGQRVFGRYGHPPQPYTAVRLSENLRNTRQIAQTFGSLAQTQMRYRGADGDPVQFIPCKADRAIETADVAVNMLLDAGWPPQSLALLTTGSRHPLHVELVQNLGKAGYWDTFWNTDDAFFGHVLGFKGLERPVVVLAVNDFQHHERARELLYVGMSRARDLLVVCGDPNELRRVAGDGVMQRLGLIGAP